LKTTEKNPSKKLEDQVADSKRITGVLSPKSAGAKLGAAGGDTPHVETSSKKGSQPVADSISPRDKLPRRAVTHSGPRGSLEKDKEKAASPRHTKGHRKTMHEKITRNEKKSDEKNKPDEKKISVEKISASDEKKPSDEKPHAEVSGGQTGPSSGSRKKSDHFVNKNRKHAKSSSETDFVNPKKGNGKTEALSQIPLSSSEHLKQASSSRATYSTSVPFSFPGINRSPTKALTAESYVKVWDQLEAIAALEENKT